MVSHDRSFIRRVGTKISEINHGVVTAYPGSYDDYVWSLQHGVLSQRADAAPVDAGLASASVSADMSEAGVPAFNYKEKKKNLDREFRQAERMLQQLEADLTKWNAELHQLNTQLQSAAASQLAELAQRVGKVQLDINHAEEQWLSVSDQRQRIESDLAELIGS